MFEGVACPVLFASDTADVVVGDGAGPHEVGAGVVVAGVFEDARDFGADGEHDGFAQAVGEFDAGGVGEVAFDDVRHHVGRAGCGLVGRDGDGEFRVHDGEYGADAFAGVVPFEHAVFTGDDGDGGDFAAGRGDGEDGCDGQDGCGDGFAVEEVPEVACVGRAECDGFGRVDDAAAADGEDEVDVFLAAQFDAVADVSASRVWQDAAEREGGKACAFQRAGDAVDEAGFDGGCTAVVDEDACAALPPDAVADVVFFATAEVDAGGMAEGEVFHGVRLLLPVMLPVSVRFLKGRWLAAGCGAGDCGGTGWRRGDKKTPASVGAGMCGRFVNQGRAWRDYGKAVWCWRDFLRFVTDDTFDTFSWGCAVRLPDGCFVAGRVCGWRDGGMEMLPWGLCKSLPCRGTCRYGGVAGAVMLCLGGVRLCRFGVPAGLRGTGV